MSILASTALYSICQMSHTFFSNLLQIPQPARMSEDSRASDRQFKNSFGHKARNLSNLPSGLKIPISRSRKLLRLLATIRTSFWYWSAFSLNLNCHRRNSYSEIHKAVANDGRKKRPRRFLRSHFEPANKNRISRHAVSTDTRVLGQGVLIACHTSKKLCGATPK